MASIVILLAVLPVLGALGGLAFVLRAEQRGLRRWLSIAASGLVLASMALFFYLPVLSDRFQHLSYFDRVDAAAPWVGSGLGFALLALVTAVFSVRNARVCLVLASCISMFLWFGIAGSLV